MSFTRFSLSLPIVALLLGCGHGVQRSPSPSSIPQPASGTSQPASSQLPPAHPADTQSSLSASRNDNRPVIVAFGDSLTAGYGVGPGQSYPDYLQQDLDARGYQYRVVNAGISGNTSKDGVARLPRVLALHPVIVIVAFGGNDGLRGIPISKTKQNMETIISTLLKAHVKVILGGITLPPNYGKPYIHQFDTMYSGLVRRFHVPLLPFILKGAYGTPGDIQPDDVHATAKGNQQVAKNFLPLLLPLLHKPAAKPAGATQSR